DNGRRARSTTRPPSDHERPRHGRSAAAARGWRCGRRSPALSRPPPRGGSLARLLEGATDDEPPVEIGREPERRHPEAIEIDLPPGAGQTAAARDDRLRLGPQGAQEIAETFEAGSIGHRTMSRYHAIEVEREHPVERRGPLADARASLEVDVRPV